MSKGHGSRHFKIKQKNHGERKNTEIFPKSVKKNTRKDSRFPKSVLYRTCET